MWSYYGSKSKVVDLYPKPVYEKIIEPFAGSARYALKYFEKDIYLYDKYDVIIKIWHHLQKCSIGDIIGLPSIFKGDNIDDFNISSDEKLLMGFMMVQGACWPQKTLQSFANIDKAKKNISENLFKIKHWKIQLGGYDKIENIEATWFVDAPYQYGGNKYKFSNKKIDFNSLKLWCIERMGQTIVCENTKASWLNFNPICKMTGAKFVTTEAIWTNYHTHFNNVQQHLDFNF